MLPPTEAKGRRQGQITREHKQRIQWVTNDSQGSSNVLWSNVVVQNILISGGIYWIWHLFLPFMKYLRRLYLARNSNCFVLIAPLRFLRISSTASSYFIPNSMSAVATRTGALPSPVTQWTPNTGLWVTNERGIHESQPPVYYFWSRWWSIREG